MTFRHAAIFLFSVWLMACIPTTILPPTANPPPTVNQPPTATPAAPSATLPPSATATPVVFAPTAPTSETPCFNGATYVEDLTIPDGKQYLPGQTENKKWSVTNTGSCDWNSGYRMILVSGDSLGAPSEVALYPAKAGTAGVWEIPITAPLVPGVYTGKWQARDPAGNLFGDTVFIKIEVIPLPTATPAP